MRDYYIPCDRHEFIKELKKIYPKGSFSGMRKKQLKAIFFNTRERGKMEEARRKAIEIMNFISNYIDEPNIFDCRRSRKENTLWFDVEDGIVEIIKRKEEE